jgi:hypothetical protein
MFLAALASGASLAAQAQGKHLFILSGQSNMARFNEKTSFLPAIELAFGKGNVIVVKDAHRGMPIRRWFIGWESPARGKKDEEVGDLYDQLIDKVKEAVGDDDIESATVLWMRGEQDAREPTGTLYRSSLERLFRQFATDLGREDLNFVLGRLSDFGLGNDRWPHWEAIRRDHQELAEASPRIAWVNTDDLNDGLNKKGEVVENGLHYTRDGYRIFGERLAEAAVSLIRKQAEDSSEAENISGPLGSDSTDAQSDAIVMEILRPLTEGKQISPTWTEVYYIVIDARHPAGIEKLQLFKEGAKKAEKAFSEKDRHESGYFLYKRRMKSEGTRNYVIKLWPVGTDPNVADPIISELNFPLRYSDPDPDLANFIGFTNLGDGDVVDANENRHNGYRDDDGVNWVELVIKGTDAKEIVVRNEAAFITEADQKYHAPYWAEAVDPAQTKSADEPWPDGVKYNTIEGFGLYQFTVSLQPGEHRLSLRAQNSDGKMIEGPAIRVTAQEE